MGYNANLIGVGIIPVKKAAAGTPVLHIILARPDQRITIPHLRAKGGGRLSVLQTEAIFPFRQGLAAGDTLTIPGIPSGLTDRTIVLRFKDGNQGVFKVKSQTGTSVTFTSPIPGAAEGMLYLLGATSSEHTSTISLATTGSTVLQADCPGVVAGKELGWPLGLFLENSDGNAEVEGGTIAYISV